MAFLLHSIDDGHVPAWEYLPVAGIKPKVGMALIQSSGNLAIATGGNAPTYISMVEKNITCAPGDIIPVIRVTKDMIFETTFSATATSLKRGDKVTLHASSGLQITANKTETTGSGDNAVTTNGVAEIVSMDGAASGSAVRVRF